MKDFKRVWLGTGGMYALVFSSLAAFSGDLGSFPSNHLRQFTTAYNTSSRGADLPFWPSQAYIQEPTHTRKIQVSGEREDLIKIL